MSYEEMIARIKKYPTDVMQWDEPGLAGDVIAELLTALETAERDARISQGALEADLMTVEREWHAAQAVITAALKHLRSDDFDLPLSSRVSMAELILDHSPTVWLEAHDRQVRHATLLDMARIFRQITYVNKEDEDVRLRVAKLIEEEAASVAAGAPGLRANTDEPIGAGTVE